jgi:outer membrane biosynthesis protein TonB
MTERKNARYWVIFISVAIVIHLILFFSIKPSFFSLFKKTVSSDDTGTPFQFSGEDAMLSISIEIEDENTESANPDDIEPAEQADQPSPRPAGRQAAVPDNIDDLIGQGGGPVQRQPGPKPAVIPPRPVEMTWPDTRNLGFCIGSTIIVSLQVETDGSIIQMLPEEIDLPEECIRAALEAAGKIVFEPGKVNGIAVKMWTRVQIDFRRESAD